MGRLTRKNSYRARLYTSCVDTGKETVYARLRRAAAGPGTLHFPEWANREYFEQLTSERAAWHWQNGRLVRSWHKINADARNEALDLELYALAALRIYLGPNTTPRLTEMSARLSARLAGQAPAPAKPEASGQVTTTDPAGAPAPKPVAPRSSWVYGMGWRR